ncbi:hypothetical protein [Microvirga terricola]|uniref:Uncharacterized protein n=1 Tax=Microvirga terricola TaxID=2719797 RepID=A0ABX0VG34_9HYPH|nr:hypothetical protein [Microvirga terricola]NIX78184.1 hypothetical protein [Microvirga terricola]
MRILLSCLLLGLLTACQTTRSSTNLFSESTRFPADKWATRSIKSSEFESTAYICPPTKCGELVIVAIAKFEGRNTALLTTEDVLRLKSVNEPLLREMANLHTTSKTGTIEIKTVRKINAEPLGFYYDGTATNAKGTNAYFAVEARVRGNRMVTGVAFSESAKMAKDSLKLAKLPPILN